MSSITCVTGCVTGCVVSATLCPGAAQLDWYGIVRRIQSNERRRDLSWEAKFLMSDVVSSSSLCEDTLSLGCDKVGDGCGLYGI